ncbi:MAG: recombinase RecT, partial [Flammeovirgaceae bacterium]
SGQAQFQIGYKGFIQLAQRSGKFKTINVSDVKEGELLDFDRLTGQIQFNWQNEGREKLKTIGYVAYFELLNGFTKLLYMTEAEMEKHGKTYSQTYKKGFGNWKDNFESMAEKTAIKLLLSKYAPLSTQMEVALISDQAVLAGETAIYPDNEKTVGVDST